MNLPRQRRQEREGRQRGLECCHGVDKANLRVQVDVELSLSVLRLTRTCVVSYFLMVFRDATKVAGKSKGTLLSNSNWEQMHA